VTCESLTLDFDGKTFDPELDGARLGRQLLVVRSYMLRISPAWKTLREISAATGEPEASVSARLRDLRKERCGSLDVQRQRRGEETRGLWEYRINPECLK
jgi:hypothetical protein